MGFLSGWVYVQSIWLWRQFVQDGVLPSHLIFFLRQQSHAKDTRWRFGLVEEEVDVFVFVVAVVVPEVVLLEVVLEVVFEEEEDEDFVVATVVELDLDEEEELACCCFREEEEEDCCCPDDADFWPEAGIEGENIKRWWRN